MKKIAGHRIVSVEWVDSTSRPGWNSLDTEADLRVISVGFLIHETKERVVLAKSIALGNPRDVHSYHSQMHIPTCCIKRLAYIT